MINLNLSSATRIGLNLVALLGAVVALRLGEPIFVPLVIAGMLAVVLWPMVRYLHQSLRVPKFLACLAAVSAVIIFNVILFFSFLVTVPRLVQDLPGSKEEQDEMYKRVRVQIEKISPTPISPEVLPEDPDHSQFFQYLRRTLTGDYVTNALLDLAYYAQIWFWQGVLILFVLLFLLHEGEMLARRVREVFDPGEETQELVTGALNQMGQAVRDYLVWRTLVNVGLGLFLGVFYQFVFELRQPWVWALLTMILCYVPYLGTIAAGIPPILDAFIYVGSAGTALGILLFYIVVVTVEGYLIVPMVMGRSMDLNATTVILSCIFWELVWGLPGLFLAMPLMASVKAVCMHVEEWKPWGKLMSTERGVREAEMQERLRRIAKHVDAKGEDTTVLMDEPSGDGAKRAGK